MRWGAEQSGEKGERDGMDESGWRERQEEVLRAERHTHQLNFVHKVHILSCNPFPKVLLSI